MMKLIEKLFGRSRVMFSEDERAVHLWKGRVQDILTPGEHTLASHRDRLEIERHNLVRPEFISVYEKALFDRIPQIAAEHFTAVDTTAHQVAVIERDGKLYAVLGPDAVSYTHLTLPTTPYV